MNTKSGNRKLLATIAIAAAASNAQMQTPVAPPIAPATLTIPADQGTDASPGQPATFLSQPALEIVDLSQAGVSKDTIATFIATSDSTYNLDAHGVIQVEALGVSNDIVDLMLSHDQNLRQQALASASAQQSAQAAPSAPPPSPADTSAQPDNTSGSSQTISADELFNALAPYGTWNDSTDQGPYWQPNDSINPTGFPAMYLSYGNWSQVGGRGWCWFPSQAFCNFDQFGNRNQFASTARIPNFNQFQTSGSVVGRSTPFRSTDFNSPVGVGGSFPAAVGGHFNGSGLGGSFNGSGIGGNFSPNGFHASTGPAIRGGVSASEHR